MMAYDDTPLKLKVDAQILLVNLEAQNLKQKIQFFISYSL